MSHYLVLTAQAGITDAHVAAVQSQLRANGAVAGDPVRLAPGAIEIALPEGWPESLNPRSFGESDCDLNIVPGAGRRKKMLIADMDSTIISVECIDELADFAGVKPQVSAITEAAMRGDLDFEQAMLARVALLKDLPESALQECFETRILLNPGARTLVRTMAAFGAETALVSGGFDFFSRRVASKAGFARHQANALVIADGRLTGDVARPILGRQAKARSLQEISERAGIGTDGVLAIGDGANDLDMISAAGLGVAWRAKPVLAEAAAARLDHSDLTAVLALQGISRSEWR